GAARTAAALLLLTSASLLQLLLTFGQFLQFAERFIHVLRVLLHFAPLNGFVLVLVLIEFKFEKIREISCVLRTTAATAATAHAHLDFIEQGVGAHQELKSLLFERLGDIRFCCLKLFGGRFHLVDGALQVLGHLLDQLVLIRQASARHTFDERVGLFGGFG